jgi:hypothetical protein
VKYVDLSPKITFGELRDSSVRRVLIYWRGAEIRPKFKQAKMGAG